MMFLLVELLPLPFFFKMIILSMQVEASATYGSKHCLRHAVVTEPIDQSHDFSFIHKFYYENYYICTMKHVLSWGAVTNMARGRR